METDLSLAAQAPSGGGALALAGALLLTLSVMAALLLNCASQGKKSGGGEVKAKAASQLPGGAKAAPAGPQADLRPRCTILFGTQTGTAERFAKALRSQLDSKYGANTAFDVVDIEQYDAASKLPSEKTAFLLMATYGDGEPTDNAAEFCTWLEEQAKGEEQLLQGLRFGVFGLGNRQYEHFCAVGTRVHKQLEALGAQPLVRVGTGDDDRDIDEDFDAWSAELFAALQAKPVFVAGEAAALTAERVAAYEVEEVLDAPAKAVDVQVSGTGLTAAAPHLARVTEVRELHAAASGRSCVHVEVDISKSKATYEAGDHVGVLVENAPEVVSAAAAALGLSLSACFRLRLPPGNSGGLPEPPAGPVTVRCLLARYADLLSAPGKGALQALAAFATDPKQAARLAELASLEGRDAYHSYVVAPKRSLLEVLQDFPSARPTLGALLGSVAPRLQPRYYSISSSPAAHPRAVHITCAVVKETMPSGRVHLGVASTYLAALAPGDTLPVFIRRSTFKLPKDPATPIVMVGPGTGLAPFRGFIQERAALVGKKKRLGAGVLYFGCRNRAHDYIYKEELETAVAAGALTELNVAFSREGPVKDYVQHHLLRQGEAVWAMLRPEAGGVLYVCGDAKHMAQDVHRALAEVVRRCEGCSAGEAEAAVKALSDGGRYLKDVW